MLNEHSIRKLMVFQWKSPIKLTVRASQLHVVEPNLLPIGTSDPSECQSLDWTVPIRDIERIGNLGPSGRRGDSCFKQLFFTGISATKLPPEHCCRTARDMGSIGKCIDSRLKHQLL